MTRSIWKSLLVSAALSTSLLGCAADEITPVVAKKSLDGLIDDLIAERTAQGGVAEVVGPEGGTVEDSATGAAIEVPAGAIPEPEEGDAFVVSVVPYSGDALEAPKGFSLAGDLFDISIESVRSGAKVDPLAPVRITLPYSSSVEEDDADLLSIGNFHSSAWVTAPAEKVDTSALRITASFSTMSPFGAVLGARGNAAPVATNQNVSIDEDKVLVGKVSGTDADGDSLTFNVAPGGDVQHGMLTLKSNGDFEYEPAENYNGSDQFTFTADDGKVKSAVATVSITVNAVNDAPVGYSKSITVDEDATVSGTVSGSDVDGNSITYALASGGDVQNGTLSLQANGSFEYSPSENYNGNDAFSFRVSDGTVYSAAATVTITVDPVNDAPTLSGLHVTTEANTPIKATLAGADIEGAALTYSVVTAPTNGTVAVTASTGVMIYTPVTNYTGTDEFYVKVSDGVAASVPVAVMVDVNGVVRYVKPASTGSGDGTSWADATANVQAAIDDVAAAGAGAVWVAKGTYRTTGTGPLITMANNVDIYGGFAGTETTLEERGVVDPNDTVFTGDTDSSGTLSAGDAYRVVVGASALLDGLTITGGNAVGGGSSSQGGGINHTAGGSTLTLSNVRVYGNHSDGDAGGIWNTQTLIIRDSTIEGNTATNSAGGLFSYYGTVTMENTAFLDNSTNTFGGALYVMYSTLDFSGGIVDGNVSSYHGGGIYINSTPSKITNVQVSNNTSSQGTFWDGGGVYIASSQVEVLHSQFIGNSALDAGGAIALSSGSLTVRNSTFYGNAAASSIDISSPSSNSLFNSCFESDLSTYGSGISQATTDPFSNPAASGEYFFDPAHGCADWGSAATATTVFSATDTDWENRTSEVTGLTMEGTTDGPAAGVLYDPLDVWIRSFDVTSNSIDWVTNASAETCSISNDENSTVVQVAANDLPTGTQAHALTSGTVVTMTCLSQLAYPKAATAAVP